MHPHRLRALLYLSLPILTLSAQPAARQWSQGDPTTDEQVAMEWLNLGRKDPVATLNSLLGQADSDPVIAAWIAGESPATAAQLEQSLQAAYGRAQANSLAFPNSAALSNAPLAFYPLFQQQAARWSAQTQPPAPAIPPDRPPPAYLYPLPTAGELLSGPGDVLSGPDATGGSAVFGPFGSTYAEVAQANLYSPLLSGREYLLTLLCQPGSGSPPPQWLTQGDSLPGLTLGHTRLAGIDVSAVAGANRVLTVFRGSSEFFTQSDLPFGAAGTVFLTGVAYQDNNANGVYDAGEGLAGVTITLDRGGWFATTATAGGYAIPVAANSGTYTATANGGPFHAASASVTVGPDNVKLDWVQPPAVPALPLQVPVAASDGSAQLVGLSTRGLVEAGTAELIGGFVISGPATTRKQLLLRGVGPSLETVGFPASECIPATQLQLVQAGAVIAANTGWTSGTDRGAAAAAAAAQAGDFPLVAWAGGGGDSALVATLPPGAYTVVVSPAPGTPAADQTGLVGLAEIYDLTPADGSQLVNLSSRGLAGSGDTQLIAGCTVTGSGHRRLLLRAAGPALAASFGLPGTLADPNLTLFDGAGQTLAANAGWSQSPQTDQVQTLAAALGAFPFPVGSADAALLWLAAPGNFTATVGPRSGTPAGGLALVEIYAAP
jgi:hypothetical protein